MNALKKIAAVATTLPVRILVSAGLLTIVALTIDWDSVSAALEDAGWGWFALATVAAFAAGVVAAARWAIFLRAADLPTRFGEAFRAQLIGTFANNFLPSAFGGDAVRGWIIGRSGKPLVRAITSVLADRATALACLLALAWIAAAIKLGEIPHDVAVAMLAASGVAVVGAVVLVVLLRREGLGRFIPETVRPWAGESAGVLRAYGRDRGLQVEVTALGFVYQAMIITAFYLLAIALDLGIDPAELTLVVPPVVILSALPISIAGFGVREAGFVVLLGEYGVSAADATLLSLLSVVAVAIASAPGGIAIAMGGDPLRADSLERR